MKSYFSLNSIKNRMISGFLFLTTLIIFLALFSLYLLNRTEVKSSIHSQVSQLQIHTLMLFKNDNDFFNVESVNENVLEDRRKQFLKERDSLSHQISRRIGTLILCTKNLAHLHQDVLCIDSTLATYNCGFAKLDSLVVKRARASLGQKNRRHASTSRTEFDLTSEEGARSDLSHLSTLITNEYLSLASRSLSMSNHARNEALAIYSALVIIAILFSVFSSIWISRKLSEPIARLSKMVRDYHQDHPAFVIGANFDNAAREVKVLLTSFNDLIERSEIQMKEIQNKSKQLKRKNFELNRVNQELDNFLYSTAHDLRSPLTSLLGLLNLLKYETRIEAHYEYHDMMRSSIVRMENFISQIVNYSKNNRLSVSTEHINLHELLKEIIEAHKYNEGSSRISWHVDINDSVPAHSDKNRLTILFNNLISNAVRYADLDKPNPFVKIQVRTDFNNIYIHFQDNGIGISPEHLTKIFDMFYRAHSSSKGSGLGLYILKQTVERMKGFVRVDSEVGTGTKFFINIRNNRAFVEHDELVPALQDVG